MPLLEILAVQNKLLKGLVAKGRWGVGRRPFRDSNRVEGHAKRCELARIFGDNPYRSLGHLRGRPTTHPRVWGQMAHAVGSVAQLAEEFGVTTRTLSRWAYQERRSSGNDIALIQVMVSVHRLKMPIFKCKSITVGCASTVEG